MTVDYRRHARTFAIAAWAMVVVAVAVRVGLYLRHRALWLDEAMLAMNVADRSIGELFKPLDYNQSAPVGFLLVVKTATWIFGQTDWVLRATPLVAGIAAAPLFLLAAQRALRAPAQVVAAAPPVFEEHANTTTTHPEFIAPAGDDFVIAGAEDAAPVEQRSLAPAAPVETPLTGSATAKHEWPAVLYAMALFAVSMPLVRYASEFKQYAFDLAASAAVLWLALRLWERPQSITRAAAFAAAGAVLVWFSHPLLFVLAGVGIITAVRFAAARDGRASGLLLVAGVVWVLSFGIGYLVSLRHYAGDAELTAWWQHAFLPFPPRSPADVKWFLWSFVSVFEHPLGLVLPGLGALAFLVGCVCMGRTQPWILALLLAPVIIALVASAFRLYPFTERFIIFLAPFLIIPTGAGMQQVTQALWPRARVAAVLLVVLVFLQPLLVLANELGRPGDPGVRPALAKLAETDEAVPVYVYHWAQFEARYYAPIYGVDMDRFVIGATARKDWWHYRGELEELRDRERVWFLFVDVPFFLGRNEEQYFLTVLEEFGQRTAEHHWPRARLYLYDLRSPAAAGQPTETTTP
ncbi:MAG: hypothetical protein WD873_04110 [Candidatus Hydrogenedentales bacterium]